MAVGHVQACAGISLSLLKRGHRVAFLIDETFRGKLSGLGFEEIMYDVSANRKSITKQNDNLKPGEEMAHWLKDHKIIGETDILEQLKKMMYMFYTLEESRIKIGNMALAINSAIDRFDPHLFLLDSSVQMPSIYKSGRPWIQVCSCVPTFYLSERKDLPPAASGMSIQNLDEEKCEPFRKVFYDLRYSKEMNDIFEQCGFERFPNEDTCPQIPSLCVYAFPEEYNYPPIKDLKGWFNVEVFNKHPPENALLEDIVPKSFIDETLNGNFSGKWIYLSMGSMGGVDIDLMSRLIKILGKTRHKYIVSKGPRHNEIKLAENMWGDGFLPQTKILPLVDLVITHGGNNSVTETFAQGKPMIIMPLFADQYDNAQRLHEMGFGKRLNPFKLTEQELIDAINDLLNDNNLKQRLLKASHRIQSQDKHSIFCDLVDEILA